MARGDGERARTEGAVEQEGGNMADVGSLH